MTIINFQSIAEGIFELLNSFGLNVVTFDKEGNKVVNPEEATRFAVSEPNLLVRIDQPSSTVSLSVSKNTENYIQKEKVMLALKKFVKNNRLYWDYKIFNKTITPKGELIDIAKNSEKDMADVMEGFGTMTGSTKTSYQGLDNVKIVVRHKKPVNEEVRGARSRNIHSIFIQRGEERFKMAENNLSASRAMARHLYNGGEIHDEIGESIINMAKDYRQLREFVRYVHGAKLVNETNQEFVELALENIDEIRTNLKRLAGSTSYATAVENIKDYGSVEVLQDDIDLESKFTETHFDDKVANVLDNLKTLASRKKSFESVITKAIQLETFDNLTSLLKEHDGVVDFATPHAKLGYQVSQLGYSAKNDMLSNYLRDVGNKITNGGSLSAFDYRTIKSCLVSAGSGRPTMTAPADIGETYEQFLNQFDQL